MYYFISGIIVGLLIALLVKQFTVVEISDIAPEEDSPKNRWLKLQNEGGKYVKKDNDRVKLKITKW